VKLIALTVIETIVIAVVCFLWLIATWYFGALWD
jgi:hypothetical protein